MKKFIHYFSPPFYQMFSLPPLQETWVASSRKGRKGHAKGGEKLYCSLLYPVFKRATPKTLLLLTPKAFQRKGV